MSIESKNDAAALKRFQKDQSLFSQLTADRLNAILDAIEANTILPSATTQPSKTKSGTQVNIREKFDKFFHPFYTSVLYDSENSNFLVRVNRGHVYAPSIDIEDESAYDLPYSQFFQHSVGYGALIWDDIDEEFDVQTATTTDDVFEETVPAGETRYAYVKIQFYDDPATGFASPAEDAQKAAFEADSESGKQRYVEKVGIEISDVRLNDEVSPKIRRVLISEVRTKANGTFDLKQLVKSDLHLLDGLGGGSSCSGFHVSLDGSLNISMTEGVLTYGGPIDSGYTTPTYPTGVVAGSGTVLVWCKISYSAVDATDFGTAWELDDVEFAFGASRPADTVPSWGNPDWSPTAGTHHVDWATIQDGVVVSTLLGPAILTICGPNDVRIIPCGAA